MSPFWFIQVEVLAWYYYAWALLGYMTRLAFRPVEKSKAVVLFPFWFIQVEVAYNYAWDASGIYNTFSMLTHRKKKK